jgi:hypothetical protein
MKNKQPIYLNTEDFKWQYQGVLWSAINKDGFVRWSRDLGHGIITYDSQQEALDDNKDAMASISCDNYYSPELKEYHLDLNLQEEV